MFKDVIKASFRVYQLAKTTPTDKLEILSKELNNDIYLKREDLQTTRSFKIRGAMNSVALLTDSQKRKGIVAASAGNHAQGIAAAASYYKVKATIFMPTTTPSVKVEAVKRFGGEYVHLRQCGSSFDQCKVAAQECAKEFDQVIVPPFDSEAVIAGQGTVGLEILSSLNNISTIVVPCGGGGLLAGISLVVKECFPDIKIISAEPEDAACCAAALNRRDSEEPIGLDRVGRFADGVAVQKLGKNTWNMIKKYVDSSITVTNDEICNSINDIYNDLRVVAEPAGAVSLAAAKKWIETSKAEGKGISKKVVAILSGANMNFSTLRYVAQRCEIESLLSVEMNHIPGSLLNLCKSMPKWQITELIFRVNQRHKKQKVLLGINTRSFAEEYTRWIQNMSSCSTFGSYKLTDLSNNTLVKDHLRYLMGGFEATGEIVYIVEFPEEPGALLRFLQVMKDDNFNITVFHYRSIGGANGSVLVGWRPTSDKSELNVIPKGMSELGWTYINVTNDPAYRLLLTDTDKSLI